MIYVSCLDLSINLSWKEGRIIHFDWLCYLRCASRFVKNGNGEFVV